MIARMWRGRATPENLVRYRSHLTGDVFPKLRRLAGNRGAKLLERYDGSLWEIVVLTFWDSPEAVAAFAGDDPHVAVVEPEARAILADFDEFVQHFEVAADLDAEAGGPA